MADLSSENANTQEVRIGQIISELHERRQKGEAFDDEQVLAEYTELAEELRPHLAMLRQLRSGEKHLERFIRQGVLTPTKNSQYVATLNGYQVIEYIGHGGMGIVLKAFDERLRRVVALKLLRNELADDATARARFLREARAAAALSHPNIVSVFEVGERGDSPYIAMEYVDGPSLLQVVRQAGVLPTELIRHLFSQLLEGLAAAHHAGLIHRDIKSSNLLLVRTRSPSPAPGEVESWILKIADFGLARITNSHTCLTVDSQPFGTPEYMSPEQARGDADIDHRTDLYSAGVVLYEMLTGRVPFQSETPTALIHQILSIEPRHPSTLQKDCNAATASIAMRLLAKRREDRFETASEVLETLQSGRRVASYERSRRQRRRASIALLLMTVIAGATWRFVDSGKPKEPISAAKGMNNTVVVQYGVDTDWKTLYRFPDPNRVMASAPVKLGASDEIIVVAGMQYPLHPDATIMAIDNTGESIWSLNLSSDRQWPDCDPSRGWQCIGLIAADLDGVPGDEILAIASDIGQYASRFSIIDPVSREVRATLWHQGGLYVSSDAIYKTFWLEPNFFGPGRHAIVCQGLNNKLDGFYEPQETDPPPLTKWDIVPVIMILDPRRMLEEVEGLAPPASPRLPYAPTRAIHAYAFLDLSATPDGTYADEGRRTLTKPDLMDVGTIDRLGLASEKVSAESGPWFTVDLKNKPMKWGTIIFVDRDLNIRKIQKMPHDPNPKPESYWREKWRVVDLRG